MWGRHGLTLPSATPVRLARNQSKAILSKPALLPSPSAPINLAGCSLPEDTVLIADAAGADKNPATVGQGHEVGKSPLNSAPAPPPPPHKAGRASIKPSDFLWSPAVPSL